MNISDLLNGPMGQIIINNVAGQLGMNQKDAANAVGVAVPAILAGMSRNAQSAEGAQSLDNALESKHDGSLLDNLAGMLGGNVSALQQDGNGILRHIFGSQKTSVEQGISQKTGLSLDKIGPMLAILAPIVMAYLGKEKRQTNTNAGGLGDLLGGLLQGSGTQQKRGGGLLGGLLTGMLDKNNDGNIVDDLLGGFWGGKK